MKKLSLYVFLGLLVVGCATVEKTFKLKTLSEQSQDELEPIISTPINSPMSDE